MSILGIINVRQRLRRGEGDSAMAGGLGSRVGSGRLAGAVFVLLLAAAGPAAAGGIDGWSSLVKWPLIPIHGVMLGDGRVLTYGTNAKGQSTGNFIYDIWNPKVGMDAASHFTLPNTVGTNLFCDAQLMLPSGKVLAEIAADAGAGRLRRPARGAGAERVAARRRVARAAARGAGGLGHHAASSLGRRIRL